MEIATAAYLDQLNESAEQMRHSILTAADTLHPAGKIYYVSSIEGNDACAGNSPAQPWRTLEKASSAQLMPGDAVLFKRGEIFRGQIICREGVTYGAWGQGEKPKIYGWTHDLADSSLWELFDKQHAIYHLREKIPDCGTLVFNDGESASRKLIPSFMGGRFVCRNCPDQDFMMENEMTHDLDLFCSCLAKMTTAPSHGEDWPIPAVRDTVGDLYLRCDAGNPGDVFQSIEALPGYNLMVVGSKNHVTIDNLCLKYGGAHAIGAGGPCVRGLHVTNCEIGWIGGTIQHYLGTDPNYPQGTRGTVTRFGNGIEIYGGCDDYLCANNCIYQIYDAGITHQFTVKDEPCHMSHIRYTGNLIDKCVYSIEYFLANTAQTGSTMDDIEIDHNFLRFAGYGWGQQRHNAWTPAHIKSWSFENPARRYRIHDNTFDRSQYRLLHLCCMEAEDYPSIFHNAYVQTMGYPLGQFGAIKKKPAPVLSCMENMDEDVKQAIGDTMADAFCVLPTAQQR